MELCHCVGEKDKEKLYQIAKPYKIQSIFLLLILDIYKSDFFLFSLSQLPSVSFFTLHSYTKALWIHVG